MCFLLAQKKQVSLSNPESSVRFFDPEEGGIQDRSKRYAKTRQVPGKRRVVCRCCAGGSSDTSLEDKVLLLFSQLALLTPTLCVEKVRLE